MSYQKRLVYLTEAQKDTLFETGSVTVGDKTIVYDDDDVYVTPQDEPVTDVQVDGVSVVDNGVATIPTDNKAPIIINSASGNIAHFTDGADGLPVKALTVNVEPVQDLHGYDSPWPAGGGKNKLQVTANTTTKDGVTFTVNTDGTVVANGTATQTVTLSVGTYIGEGVAVIASGCPSGGNRTDKYRIFNTYIGSDEGNGTPTATPEAGVSCGVTLYVYAGYTATNLVFKPMIRLASVTDATFAPYSNVCPITGWTGAKVSRTGKNLCQGFERYNTTNYLSFPVFLKAGKQYTISFESDTMPNAIYLRKGAFNTEAEQYKYNSRQWTFAPNESRMYLFQFYKSGSSGWDDYTFSNVQIELGSTATDYEPYQGETYDITFPSEAGTVYGGTLDVTNGVLTVDRSQIASYAGETLPSTWISDRDVYSAGATPTTGAQVVYELAAPIEIPLTPQEITTLLGTNNIWADTGDTAVSYRADTKLFVEQNMPDNPVQDVQVNGVSVLDAQGVANVPLASDSTFGAVKIGTGLRIVATDNTLRPNTATAAQAKAGTASYYPITPLVQDASTFYGLAKVAGSDEKNSTLPVGQYTESAKSAISTMLNAPVSVTGSTPTITALAGVQYVCGEVSTLDITLPASGCVDVRFESGSTPTVLTITPPTGMTMKWANGFDPAGLDANTVYEINICDGLGVAASWT